MRQQYPAINTRLLIFLYGAFALTFGYWLETIEAWSMIILIVQLVVLDMLLKESTIFQTPLIRIFYGLTSLVIVGSMFILLHFPYGHLIVSIGLGGMALVYTYRVAKKHPMSSLDISKWLWFVTSQTSTIFILWRLPYSRMSAYISLGAFFLMMLAFFLSPRTAPQHTAQQTDSDEQLLDQL